MDIRTQSPEETAKVAREIAQKVIERGPQSQATVIALSGELGAGKTAFAKGFAKALGIEEEITSPTFVIEKAYPVTTDIPFDRLIHIDAYRLEAKDNLDTIGFPDRLKDPKNIILLEWPEQIPGALPADALTVTFKHVSETERDISHG
jgi:tRNA threonylcarbamoyladenosine biosynthesis protein TsaE